MFWYRQLFLWEKKKNIIEKLRSKIAIWPQNWKRLIIDEILKWLYLFLGLGDRIKSKIYEPISSENRQAETFEDFKEIVIPMLLALGPYAYHDGILLYKVSIMVIRVVDFSSGG
jgi:hypothetical protein